MSLLVLENIVKEYRNQSVLNGVNLRVEKGDRIGLVGPNGTGKTTLLKIAMGFENSDIGSVIIARNIKVGYLSQDLNEDESLGERSEEILHYEKVSRLEMRLRELEGQMAELSCQSETSLYKKLMHEYSKLLIRYEAMDGYTIEVKIKKILLGLGLRQETLGTPLSKLSGGERMRVAIAKILLQEPDLLILDEPTNHLDIYATEWFEGFLKKFEGGVLFVSHDRYFLDRVATRIAELEKGTICIRSGNYSSYLEYKNQLRQSVLNEQNHLRWIIKNTNEKIQGLKSKGKIRASNSKLKEMKKYNRELKISLNETKEEKHLNRVGGPRIEFKKVKHISKDIAWAQNLKKRFGDVTLFSGADFHIRGGERIGIIGPNGCGKTTLINMLLGNDKIYEGFLRLGEWVKYSYMGQEVLFQDESLTVLQLIISKQDMKEREARDYLAGFQFYGDEVNKSIKVLSGGERVRLYLACVMLDESDCLILDEPTNHLDMLARDSVEAALREFRGTIIAVTHDRYYLTHCVEKIFEIENGKVNIYEGNYDFYKNIKYGANEDVEESNLKSDKGISKSSISKKHGTTTSETLVRSRQEIEFQIQALEEKVKEMEEAFDIATPHEKYKEYAELVKKVDSMYSKWEQLIT